MSNGTLILMRHGESEWNASNQFTGWVDVALTAKGRAEATHAGELLVEHDLLPDVLYTSLLRRAITTANIALDAADRIWIPVVRDWRLNERHYGALQGKNKAEIREEFKDYPVLTSALDEDRKVTTQDEALLDIYKKIRPGEPPSVEAGRTLLENFLLPRLAREPISPVAGSLLEGVVDVPGMNRKVGLDFFLGLIPGWGGATWLSHVPDVTGDGIAELWAQIVSHRERMTGTGEQALRRREQQVKWMWSMLEQRVFTKLHTDAGLRARLPQIEAAVADGRLSPTLAVEEIAAALGL